MNKNAAWLLLMAVCLPAGAAPAARPEVRKVVARVRAQDGRAATLIYGMYDAPAEGTPGYFGCFRSSVPVVGLPERRSFPGILSAVNADQPFAAFVFGKLGADFRFPHAGYRSAVFEKAGDGVSLVLAGANAWTPELRLPACTARMLTVRNPERAGRGYRMPGWVCTRKVEAESRQRIEVSQKMFARYQASLWLMKLDIAGQSADFPSLTVDGNDREQVLRGTAPEGTFELKIDLTKEIAGDREGKRYAGLATVTWKGKKVAGATEFACGRH